MYYRDRHWPISTPDRTPPIDVTIPESIGDQPGDLGRIGEAIGFSGVSEGAIEDLNSKLTS
jgi:hypothetical protein